MLVDNIIIKYSIRKCEVEFMKKILVVEDDIILNSGLCYNLQLNGYSPESAYDYKASIELINKNNYELIILDVNLHEGNGFDICSYVRRNSNIPVIRKAMGL